MTAMLLMMMAFVPPSTAAVDARLADTTTTRDTNARIVAVTEPFLGALYVLSPLGEGSGPDADVRLRLDAFDCTTFVETALAFTLSSSLSEAQSVLDAIRYRHGEVGFVNRRHFPEAEWIPDLVQAGILADVTREIGGAAVRTEHKHLDVNVWRRARHHGLPDLPEERIPRGDFALDVWPLADAAAHSDRILPGSILHVVRVDFHTVPVRVSHQGLVIQKAGVLYLRHAADRMHHRVVDERLDRFLARMQQYKRWPVFGIHLTRITPQADWRTRLLPLTAAQP